jgi:hypothetical protein
MVTSIGGLSERWAQIAALQPAQAVRPTHNKTSSPGNGSTDTPDLPQINSTTGSPVAGGPTSPLSNDTNFLLTMFGNGAQSLSRPSGQAHLSASSQSAGRGADSAGTHMQPDARSNPFVPPANAGADGITGSTLVQQLQALVSAPGRGRSSATNVPATSSPPPSGSDAIGNSNTVEPSWHNGWDNTTGPGDRGRQQMGLAAYASGNFSGQDDVTASVLQGVTV